MPLQMNPNTTSRTSESINPSGNPNCGASFDACEEFVLALETRFQKVESSVQELVEEQQLLRSANSALDQRLLNVREELPIQTASETQLVSSAQIQALEDRMTTSETRLTKLTRNLTMLSSDLREVGELLRRRQ
jgi:chromosome segregation ATPase